MEKLEILLKDGRKLYVDSKNIKNNFVNISEVSAYFQRQNQYLSTYFNPKTDSKQLGEGLRIKIKDDDYHSMEFHKEDIPEIIERLKIHYNSLMGKDDTEERINEYYKYR
jgi:hypothetical protein